MDSVSGVSEAFSYSSLTVFNWSEFLPHPKYKYQTLGTFHPQVQHEIQKLNTRNKYNRNYISPGPHWSQLATSGNRGPRSGPPRLPAVTKVQTSRGKNKNQRKEEIQPFAEQYTIPCQGLSIKYKIAKKTYNDRQIKDLSFALGP